MEKATVSRVLPMPSCSRARNRAKICTAYSLPVLMMIKESVNRAYESSLQEGLLFERRSFHAAFATNDRREGMTAFIEKRKPGFTNS